MTMTVRLDTLEMTPEQQYAAFECVRKLAYEKWVEAGQPDCCGEEFWLDAEREWIERYYVPPRSPAPGNGRG